MTFTGRRLDDFAALNSLDDSQYPSTKKQEGIIRGMDGFDDLLAPSRAALEQNPFADPFGKRSDSPDPWASYIHGSSSQAPDDEASVFEDVRSTTPTLESPGFGEAPAAELQSLDEPVVDPLESSRANEPEEVVPEPSTPTESRAETVSLRSPGFRESVPPSIDESLATPVSERKPSPPPIVSPPTSTAPSSTAPSPPISPVDISPAVPPSNATSATSIASFTSSLPPPPISAQRPFFSPLEQPQSTERSFAGLALGGETSNEWQGSQSMFVGPTKQQPIVDDDEDDDDDKPILQARMSLSERMQGTSALVRLQWIGFPSVKCERVDT